MNSSDYSIALRLLSIVPLMALVPLVGCIWRGKEKRARNGKWPGILLLVLTVLVGAAAAILILATSGGIEDYVYLSAPAALAADMAREAARQSTAMLYLYCDAAVIIMSIIVSVWLASRQGRAILLWFLMGLFGNAGSVVWLIVNRRRNS